MITEIEIVHKITDDKMSDLQKMAEEYCYLTHDDKPTISQKGLELVIIEALRYLFVNTQL